MSKPIKRARGRPRSLQRYQELREIWVMVEAKRAERTSAGATGQAISDRNICRILFDDARETVGLAWLEVLRLYKEAKALHPRLAPEDRADWDVRFDLEITHRNSA